MKNGKFWSRLNYAMAGIAHAIKNEKSIRTHLLVATGVYGTMFYLRPSLVWWGIVTLLIVSIVAAEIFNSAIENLCDYVQPSHHQVIKNVKDLAAGAVLVLSIGAIIIACLLVFDRYSSGI